MVERSLSMREVPGSIPGASKSFSSTLCLPNCKKKFASSGNRTRAARVAGEHSTTEPTMLPYLKLKNFTIYLGRYIFSKCINTKRHPAENYILVLGPIFD